MAEINQGAQPKNTNGKVRAKRSSTKIDMTPMVDLAFLLLTFFILTSTFSDKTIMQVDMPDKQDNSTPQQIKDKDVLNVVLGSANKIYWWIGLEPPVKETTYGDSGIRKLFLEKRANPKLMVLIKPADDSHYANIVDVLDEIAITGIERYAIVDYTDDDKDIIGSRDGL